MQNHEFNLWHVHSQAIAHVIFVKSISCIFFFILIVLLVIYIIIFNICIARILSELSFFLVYARHMQTATLTFKSFSQSVRCSLMPSWCCHMHNRDLQWSDVNLFEYLENENIIMVQNLIVRALHRLEAFISDPDSTFPTLRKLKLGTAAMFLSPFIHLTFPGSKQDCAEASVFNLEFSFKTASIQ